MNKTNIKAVVCSCIDFRFQEFVEKFIERNGLKGTSDRIAIAGVSKDISVFQKEIELSVDLHHPGQVIMLHHEDCAAFGGSSNFKTFKEELEANKLSMIKAKKLIIQNFPDVDVTGMIIRLNGDILKVSL